MSVKSIRLTDDVMKAVALVEKREHLDGSAAIRKLIRSGLESYVANLYRHGALTLREAADRLGLNMVETMDLLSTLGVKGNLDASDVLESIERLPRKQK